jgi:hypothetical protein
MFGMILAWRENKGNLHISYLDTTKSREINVNRNWREGEGGNERKKEFAYKSIPLLGNY